MLRIAILGRLLLGKITPIVNNHVLPDYHGFFMPFSTVRRRPLFLMSVDLDCALTHRAHLHLLLHEPAILTRWATVPISDPIPAEDLSGK